MSQTQAEAGLHDRPCVFWEGASWSKHVGLGWASLFVFLYKNLPSSCVLFDSFLFFLRFCFLWVSWSSLVVPDLPWPAAQAGSESLGRWFSLCVASFYVFLCFFL